MRLLRIEALLSAPKAGWKGTEMANHPTSTRRPTVDISRRAVALIAGIGLLVMAVLAPLAHFGVLQNLFVPADAAATVENIIASEGSSASPSRRS